MNIQITKEIFLFTLEVLKKILDLGEFKFGKKSDDFIYFKKKVMDYFYKSLHKLFRKLENEKIIQKCECKHSLRKGYSDCPLCGGSGYKTI